MNDKLNKILETDWFSQRVDAHIQFEDGEDEVKLLLTGKDMLGIYFNSPLNAVESAEVSFHHLAKKSNGDIIDLISSLINIPVYRITGYRND
jgi:hypothetical protein